MGTPGAVKTSAAPKADRLAMQGHPHPSAAGYLMHHPRLAIGHLIVRLSVNDTAITRRPHSETGAHPAPPACRGLHPAQQ